MSQYVNGNSPVSAIGSLPPGERANGGETDGFRPPSMRRETQTGTVRRLNQAEDPLLNHLPSTILSPPNVSRTTKCVPRNLDTLAIVESEADEEIIKADELQQATDKKNKHFDNFVKMIGSL